MGKTKILRVGIVGCGRIFRSHNHAYPDQEYVVVTGFYDRIKKKRKSGKLGWKKKCNLSKRLH